MISVDESFAEGSTSHWCVTDEIFKIGMEWNGKMNPAWGVEMKMWEIPEVVEPTAAPQKKKGSGPKPGGSWTDSEGNIVEWEDGQIEVGNKNLGTLVISDDQIRVKMNASGLAATVLSAATVMASLN